jgi:hypothetical protein
MIAPIKKQLAKAFPVYELKITLCGSKPAIWRRVQVSGGIKLNRLHDVLQIVMGWTDSHLHQFRVGEVSYSLPSDDGFYPDVEQRDERRFRLADIAQPEKASFIYEYDFGDGWEHEVVVEKVLAAVRLLSLPRIGLRTRKSASKQSMRGLRRLTPLIHFVAPSKNADA